MTDKFLVQTSSASPFMKIWGVSGDTFTVLTSPTPVGGRTAAKFTNDGVYLATAGTNGLQIFKRSGDTFTSIYTNPGYATLRRSIAWSPDGTYLMVQSAAAMGGVYLHVIKRTGDTFAPLPTTAVTGAPTINEIQAIDVYGDYYAIQKSQAAPYTVVYKRTGDTWAAVTLPSPPTGSQGGDLAFSSDGLYLIASSASGAAASFAWWKRSGDTFTKLTAPSGLTQDVGGVLVSTKAGYVLTVATGGPADNRKLWKRTGDILSLVQNIGSFGIFDNTGVWSGDDIHVAVYRDTTTAPVLSLYRRTIDAVTDIGLPAETITSGTPGLPAWWPNVARDTLFKAISGHVYDSNGAPISRKVRAYRRDTGNLVAEAISDASTGEYGIDAYGLLEHYVLVLDDDKNAMIYDHITPTA